VSAGWNSAKPLVRTLGALHVAPRSVDETSLMWLTPPVPSCHARYSVPLWIAIVGNSAVRTSFPAPREIVGAGVTGAMVTGPVKLVPPSVLVKITWLTAKVPPLHCGSSTVIFSAMT